LRDVRTDGPPSPAPPPRDLFAATPSAEPAEPERGGFTIAISIWLVAALCLVAGIVIGFGSGYAAGRRATAVSASPAEAGAPDGLPELSPDFQQRESSTFTEGTVQEPVRVDPPPVVPAAEVPAPEPITARRPAPRPPQPARTEPPRAELPASQAARPEPPPTGPGSLQVLSRPAGANVLVDGRLVGRTPLVLSGVSAGAHDVRLELDGFRRWSTSVEVRPGSRARVAASLEQ
jgi:hypothetical protein